MSKQKTVPIYGIDRFDLEPKTDGFKVEKYDCNRNFEVAYPHRHDGFYEILFITNGVGQYIIDGVVHNIKKDSLYFVSPGQIHDIAVSKDIDGFIFLFTDKFYQSQRSDSLKLFQYPFFYPISSEILPSLKLDKSTSSKLYQLFQMAISEAQLSDDESPDMVRSYLELILGLCKRIFPKDETIIENKRSALLVRKFKKLVEEQIGSNYSLKQYAQLLNITPNHLSEVVKSVTGKTSTEIIDERLMMEIKRMLVNTPMTITEIANNLNFSDQSYFAKFFKKYEGIPPKKWRLDNCH
jgi:AraC-like DNA-binding protein/mannose-6-phosphate isomerase-like protein (cupin superfamily)